jgi:hypothetical protein
MITDEVYPVHWLLSTTAKKRQQEASIMPFLKRACFTRDMRTLYYFFFKTFFGKRSILKKILETLDCILAFMLYPSEAARSKA